MKKKCGKKWRPGKSTTTRLLLRRTLQRSHRYAAHKERAQNGFRPQQYFKTLLQSPVLFFVPV